jgi:predicted lactoylglutathione lyase
MEFFGKLGFKFNPVFNYENTACMMISEDNYSMLLVEKFFKNFIPDKDICNTKNNAEALVSLSAKTRGEVDEMIKKAEAGGTEYMQVQDYCWKYDRAFQDIDGHILEILYADNERRSIGNGAKMLPARALNSFSSNLLTYCLDFFTCLLVE